MQVHGPLLLNNIYTSPELVEKIYTRRAKSQATHAYIHNLVKTRLIKSNMYIYTQDACFSDVIQIQILYECYSCSQ